MHYPHLFQPITIGSTQLKNRIALAPMNNGTQVDPATGNATSIMADYFAERARGGAGLLVTGVFKVEYDIEQCINLTSGVRKWAYFSPQSVRVLGETVARVHAYDSKIFFQLSAGPGRVTPADVIRSGVQPVSASDNEAFSVPDVICRALETYEVERIVEAFAEAARFAKSINADGIEVHGHEGYLIDQFASSIWNRRTDKYGGDLRARLTFPIEILHAIKDAAGADFTVTYRMAARHFIESKGKGALHASAEEFGRDVAESIKMAKILEEAGYDGLSLDVGVYESSYWAHPPNYFERGYALEFTSAVKHAVRVPVMSAGRLGSPSLANDAVATGKTDIVALARDLLADPEWPLKVALGQIDRIRPCIGCHEGCIDRTRTHGNVLSCSVNPTAGREQLGLMIPVRAGKRVLVAGGGAAGMEVARIAAKRGHDVTLFERSGHLGGHMLEYGVPRFKDDIKNLLNWYKNEIDESGVKVEFNADVTADLVETFKPDVIVAATGSYYPESLHSRPSASGCLVVDCASLLRGDAKARGAVVIVGGGPHGAETALWLFQQGMQVTIIDRQNEILTSHMSSVNRRMLIDLLDDAPVPIMREREFVRVVADGIEVLGPNGIEFVAADTVVMAIGVESSRDLYEQLVQTTPNVHVIGDARSPRKLHDAIYEGWYLGLTL
jgi:2-enoate reductase